MRRYWILANAIIVCGFAVLAWMGTEVYQKEPPIPERVVTPAGDEVFPAGDIRAGQHVWQSIGGMEVGSFWGHGSYVAPDWTADYLHREASLVLDQWAQAAGADGYEALPDEDQAALRQRLHNEFRASEYDEGTKTLTISEQRAAAFETNRAYYEDVFTKGRSAYAIPEDALTDTTKLRQLTAFFFWGSWASAAARPGDDITYTSNWPSEPLVGNEPTGATLVWTGVSVILLIAGIGSLLWFFVIQRNREGRSEPPPEDPLIDWTPTPSQKATAKYFAVVAALFLVQILMGGLTAHYGVSGESFYGIPLTQWLPYAITRTWHLQTGLFWIATSWLGAGLFIAPLIAGREPKGQRALVNVLFAAVLVVAVGSLAGEALAVHQKLTGSASFFFGIQGYEYLDLGRFWQAALFLGLIIWFLLLVRVIRGAWQRSDASRKPLLAVFVLSTGAIALFYGAGLMYGRDSSISVVEYWRWWVVHLWVEGFFEVFATTVIAFVFARLGLIKPRLAAQASLLSAAIYLAGGIIGTGHHLYWAGTPISVLALGATFSALEVVPLALVAFPALKDLAASRAAPWMAKYRWPIHFFVAVGFWNLIGAGVFGFMINPPIALYYMQGLTTTPVHAHGALFGVYGMLGLGLMLLCLRVMNPRVVWREGLLKVGFWLLNIGLVVQIFFSMLPLGLSQTWASVNDGYAYARSSEFLERDWERFLRWMRLPGDLIFTAGAIALVVFVFGLWFGWSVRKGRAHEGPGHESSLAEEEDRELAPV